MTDPLIDRKGLVGVIFQVMSDTGGSMTAGMTADAVLTYLRSVLTPEALNHIYGPVYEYRENGAITVRATGAVLHRRIFGEDK